MSVRTVMMAMVCLACSAALVSAEDAAPQVMVAGSATLQKQPTELRVSMTVVGEGKDLAEALSKLAKVRDDAHGKLAALKPMEDSFQVTEATMADVATMGMNAQQRQYQMLMQMRGGAKPPAKAVVTAASTITASFALPAVAGDEALVKAHELEKQIRAAVAPAGGGDAKKLTAEEQELAEEMAAMGQSAGAKPGEPSFAYVLTVSDTEATKVTADALAKAHKHAALLADAAGMKLGAIRTLRSDVDNGSSMGDMTGMSGIFRAAMGVAADQTREATSPTAGPISYSVTVNVSYELAKK
jgi:uncharacterized protein YggE